MAVFIFQMDFSINVTALVANCPNVPVEGAYRPNDNADFLQIVSIPNVTMQRPYSLNVTVKSAYRPNITAPTTYQI